MVSHDEIFGKMSINAIERNFRGACSSVETLKGYMVRESLGTPDLIPKRELQWLTVYQILSYVRFWFREKSKDQLSTCSWVIPTYLGDVSALTRFFSAACVEQSVVAAKGMLVYVFSLNEFPVFLLRQIACHNTLLFLNRQHTCNSRNPLFFSGTNERVIIEILAGASNSQRQELKSKFKQLFGRVSAAFNAYLNTLRWANKIKMKI